MKYVIVVALSTLSIIALSDKASARPTEPVLKRLDILEKENAALRERMHRLEAMIRQMNEEKVGRPSTHGRRTTKARQLPKRSIPKEALAQASPDSKPASPFLSPYRNEAHNWTGFYIGGHVGKEFANTVGFSNMGYNFSINSTTDQDFRGWQGGLQFGYNYQIGHAVLGFELSSSWGDVTGQSSSGVTYPGNKPPPTQMVACFQRFAYPFNSVFLNPSPITINASCKAKQDWSALALARLGYAFDEGRFLPYLAAGLAVSQMTFTDTIFYSATFTGITSQTTNNVSRTLVGVALGAGVQYALGNNFSMGIEYLYTKFPSEDFSNGTSNETHDLTAQTVRLVGNYKFSQ
jgi:outer membrane immunogenic protein